MNTTAIQKREKPILFSGPMVRAILDGCKTQTRRVIKPEPSKHEHNTKAHFHTGEGEQDDWTFDIGIGRWKCPYGKQGDRLWVRETWADVTRAFQTHDCEEPKVIAFAADDAVYNTETMTFLEHRNDSGIAVRKWKPSIFLPHCFSRISLEITDVRVERLKGIPLEDAQSEGIEIEQVEQSAGKQWLEQTLCHFIKGWDALNAKRGYSWDSNPWVWVIEFKKVEKHST